MPLSPVRTLLLALWPLGAVASGPLPVDPWPAAGPLATADLAQPLPQGHPQMAANPEAVPAQDGEAVPPTRLKWDAQYNQYANNSGMVVRSPSADLSLSLDDRTQLAVSYGVDSVSAASFNYAQSKTHVQGGRTVGTCFTCHPHVDALTGATHNYVEVRQEGDFSVKRRIGETDLILSYTRSNENDYFSETFKVGVDQNLFGRNTTLSLSFHHMSDAITSVIDPTLHQSLYTNGLEASWTQVLNPGAVAKLGLVWADAQGYESEPYAFIEVGNNSAQPLPQVHPPSRQHGDLVMTLKQALPLDSALQANYRYYQDSWAVRAHTFDVTLSKKIGTLVIEPEYRYYVQSQADFFQNFYAQFQTYMTRDLKLAAFSTQFLSLALRGEVTPQWGFELRYSHYLRADSLDYSRYFADGPTQADLFQVGVSYQ